MSPVRAGLPTGFAVPVLETGSPGPAGFAGTAKGGGKAEAARARKSSPESPQKGIAPGGPSPDNLG